MYWMPWPWWMSQSTTRILGRQQGAGAASRPGTQPRMGGAGWGLSSDSGLCLAPPGSTCPALSFGPAPCSPPGTHLCSPCFCWAYLAAMATLLNTQNPLAAALWLWCPGGLGVREACGEHQGHPVPTCRGSPQSRKALTSPGQAHCALLPSALHPPAAARPLQPAGHSGRYSVGAGVQMSPRTSYP